MSKRLKISWKTFSIIGVLLVLSIFALTLLSDPGNLGCPDLSDCGGTPYCGTAGKVKVCLITCDGGGSILCPPKL